MLYSLTHLLKTSFKTHCLIWLSSIFFVYLSWTLYANSVLLENIPIVTRKQWWADETWRNYKPKPIKTGEVVIYKPQKDDYQKKWSLAESTIVKWFKKEFKLDEIRRKNIWWAWLKRPVSIKKQKQKIIIHHTAWSLMGVDTLSWERAVIQDIYRFHTFTRERWDIGYNYIIWPLGSIYEGRAWWPNAVWAHASWNNTESIGIALIGNFDKEQVTSGQLESLQKLLVALCKKYTINPMKEVIYHTFDSKSKAPYIHNHVMDSLIGHRDVGDTSCPGKYLYELLPELKWSVAKELWYVQAK